MPPAAVGAAASGLASTRGCTQRSRKAGCRCSYGLILLLAGDAEVGAGGDHLAVLLDGGGRAHLAQHVGAPAGGAEGGDGADEDAGPGPEEVADPAEDGAADRRAAEEHHGLEGEHP